MRFLYLFLILVLGCRSSPDKSTSIDRGKLVVSSPFIEVLGIVQDAGYPQIGCKKACCVDIWQQPEKRKFVSSLGLVDQKNQKAWIFDATPDFKDQHDQLLNALGDPRGFAGIFLTHAHMGHYTGLMDLGREAMGATSVPVYAMPRMKNYLETNGPWSQLVKLKNIATQKMNPDSLIVLNDQVSVEPILVPHRDEFSETVGFRISGPTKSALFIPDIDKWNKWERSIVEAIDSVDYAFLDGTFYRNGEIPGRDMALIPHPFIEESLALFSEQSKAFRQKIYFIHFNHTNPLLRDGSPERKEVQDLGFHIAEQGLRLPL